MYSNVYIMQRRASGKREDDRPKLTEIVTIRMDKDLYNWLHGAQRQLFQDDISSTVRFLLRLMQYLVETGQIGIPDDFQLRQFSEFIQGRKHQPQQSPRRSDDIPP